VVATPSQCHIYSTSNFNTPHIFDLQQPLQLLMLCKRCMLLVDAANGMQVCAGTTPRSLSDLHSCATCLQCTSALCALLRIQRSRWRCSCARWPRPEAAAAPRCSPHPSHRAARQVVTYEGRIVCTPRAPGMRPELLAPQMVALSPDTLAAMDGPGGSSVRLFDTAQVGRLCCTPTCRAQGLRSMRRWRLALIAVLRLCCSKEQTRGTFSARVQSAARPSTPWAAGPPAGGAHRAQR
jgi:hypothetical protein